LSKFLPKSIPDDAWTQITPNRDYAVRAEKTDTVNIRFGAGQGVFLAIAPAPSGRLVFGVDYETGEQTLLARMPEGQPIVIGRISECLIKIMHAIVSRKHVEIRLEGAIVILRDLGSTNGTFLAPETPHFDIQRYIENNPLEGAEDRTLDTIHELFGPTLDDFLRSYSQNKKENPK
jgi:hypothetical protein